MRPIRKDPDVRTVRCSYCHTVFIVNPSSVRFHDSRDCDKLKVK